MNFSHRVSVSLIIKAIGKRLMAGLMVIGIGLCAAGLYAQSRGAVTIPYVPDSIIPAEPEPVPLWTKAYGRPDDDQAYSVQVTSDGGYIIVGSTWSNVTSDDIYFIKTNVDGDTSWTRVYGTIGADRGYGVSQTSDGGYIIVGARDVGTNSGDIFLVKTNSSGDSTWTRTYGGAGLEQGFAVEPTADGGYIITGVKNSDLYLLKINNAGDSVWARNYGGVSEDCGYAVTQTSDGGYIITGGTRRGMVASDSSDVFVVRTDSLGDSTWTRHYGGGFADYGRDIQPTVDGGYIIAGYTGSFGDGRYDVYLIKINEKGDSLWTKTYGGPKDDWGYSVSQTSDGGYIICGTTANTDSLFDSTDVYAVKVDDHGNLIWEGNYGGNKNDWGFSARTSTDGGYIIAGATQSFGAGKSDVYLVKTEAVIKLQTPAGGESWSGGLNNNITWQPENMPMNSYWYRLLFSRNGGNTYPDTIADNINVLSNEYSWTIPAINSRTCRVRLELADAKMKTVAGDESDYDFTIDADAPTIENTTVWTDTTFTGPFTIQTLVFDSLAGVDSVFLYYRRDGDPSWLCRAMDRCDDSCWIDSIPMVNQPGDTVRYYIAALDRTEPGNVMTDPEGAPDNYYLFMAGCTGITTNARPCLYTLVLEQNPVQGVADFNLVISVPGIAELRIYDITGRLVDVPFKGWLDPGLHRIRWFAETSAGVYFYSLSGTAPPGVGKFILLR